MHMAKTRRNLVAFPKLYAHMCEHNSDLSVPCSLGLYLGSSETKVVKT